MQHDSFHRFVVMVLRVYVFLEVDIWIGSDFSEIEVDIWIGSDFSEVEM